MRRIQAAENLPISDALRFGIGVDHQSRDGYETNDPGIGPARFGAVDYTAVRASLVADLTPEIENYTIASYVKSDTNGDVQKLVGCSPTFSLGPFACAQIAAEQVKGAGFYTLQSTLTNPK